MKKKIIAIVIALAIVIVMPCFGFVVKAEIDSEITIKSSEINNMINGSEECPIYLVIDSTSSGYNLLFQDNNERDITLVMDQELNVLYNETLGLYLVHSRVYVIQVQI